MKTLKQMKQEKEFKKLNKIVELNKGNNIDISITKSNGKNLDWNDIELLIFIFNKINGNNIKDLNQHNVTSILFNKDLKTIINLNPKTKTQNNIKQYLEQEDTYK